MSTGTTMANGLLSLYFLGEAIANVADNAATTPFTEMKIAFHTASPAGGNQSTNECDYTGYERVTKPRSSTDWTVTDNECSPNSAIAAPPSTSVTQQIATHWSIGRGSSSTNPIDFFGTITPNITITNGIAPQMSVATIIRIP